MKWRRTIHPASGSRAANDIETLLGFYAFNVLFLMVVGHGYLNTVPAGTSTIGWLATLLAFTANFAMLALAPLALSLLGQLARRLWIALTVGIVSYALLAMFIYADSIIYQLWHFHFNSMVLNLLTTSGAGDSVTAGKSTVLTTALIICLIIAAEVGFVVFGLPSLLRSQFVVRQRGRKAIIMTGLAVAGLILADKAVFDAGDLRDDVEIVRLKHLLPLYQTVTIKKFANRQLGMNISPTAQLKVHPANGSFQCPKSPLRFRPDGPRPNILVVAIEGARSDMLTPEVMPFLSSWGASNIVCDLNYSGGNTTRYGIFGMIYGIYGSYWQPALGERAGPPLIHGLKQLGYNFRILSCTDLNYPEFRSTCFIEVPETISDRWYGDRPARDRHMTDEFLRFLDEKKSPFFTFLFYDASHQPYWYPPEDAILDVGGVTEDINYLKLPHDPAGMTLIKNRYKNSLHYVDTQLRRALQGLEERGLLDNTLVFVMGDHGEEFRECGLFGHDSSFNRYQTKTIMVAHLPHEAPRHVQRLTSHLDVPATILDYLGVENPPTEFTQGFPLLASQEPPYVFVATWEAAAIIDHNTTITFGLEAYKTDLTIYDNDYIPLPQQHDALAARKSELLSALEGMRQFTK